MLVFQGYLQKNLPALQPEMGHRDLTLLRTRYVSPGGAHEGRLYRDEKNNFAKMIF